MGETGEYFAERPFTIEGGRAQPVLSSDEQWARDNSGLCGRADHVNAATDAP